MRKKRGNVNEVAGLRACRELAPVAPANFAPARQDECDRVLFAVMVDAGSCAWLDLEEAAPNGRTDAQGWSDRGETLGA